jgi:hypothetical protein
MEIQMIGKMDLRSLFLGVLAYSTEKNIRIRGVSRIGKFAQAAKAFKQSSAKDAKVRASSTAKEKNYGSKK